MRHPIIATLCVSSALVLAACEKDQDADVERKLENINVIDESNLNDIMLQAADPKEAVTYFRRTLADNPDRIDVRRGLGLSLTRAKMKNEAVPVWKSVVAHPESTSEDRINYSDALIRNGGWDEAKVVLNSVPPTYETYKRYRLEAMIADGDEDWKKADSFYEIAVGLTAQPSSALNNWGYSKLSRGDYAGAEDLFAEALKYDSSLFTAKNNIVLARGAQRKYELPIVPMTQVERAQLLHTMALAAVKQGDVVTGKSLLQEAIDMHPQYFEVAVRSMRALDDNQLN